MEVIEALLKRDRQVVLTALILVIVLAWAYTLAGTGMGMNAFEMTAWPWPGSEMNGMAVSDNPTMGTAPQFIALLLMWWLMMIAMMLPSAAPTILLASAINRRSDTQKPPYGSATWFTSGYLSIWLFFSLVAVVVQNLLESSGNLGTTMHSNSQILSALLLCAAGAWQLTPAKQACLRHCRSPVHYLTTHRKPGNLGALRMGMGHGAFCLGCCWFLMALLFAGGVMNVYWIAGLALFVLIEKTVARGVLFGKVVGGLLIVAGISLLIFSV